MNYIIISEQEADNWLRENLSEKRYIHSIGTMQTAEILAKKYGIDVQKAKMAGLLHDCAKCFTREDLLNIIRTELKDVVDENTLVNHKTYHAPVSAYIANKKFGVQDEEILSAIACHTLGKPGMSTFDKIIFLADKIEPNTRKSEHREEILKILEEENGLDKALFRCFSATIKSLVDRRLAICQVTIDVYNELLNKLNG